MQCPKCNVENEGWAIYCATCKAMLNEPVAPQQLPQNMQNIPQKPPQKREPIMKKRNIIFIIIILFAVFFIQKFYQFSKCVFSKDVLRDYERIVDVSNGVDKREAGLIAQHELVVRKIPNYFFNIRNIELRNNNSWVVSFYPFGDGPEPTTILNLCVDKADGKISCWKKVPGEIKATTKPLFLGPIVIQRVELKPASKK